MKIIWNLHQKYLRGHKVYKCSFPINIYPNKFLIRGELSVALNGRKTAFIQLEKWCTNFTNYKFGFYLYKHFSGHNASHSARAWFKYLVNNLPNGHGKLEEEGQK